MRKYKYLQGVDATLDIAILEYGLAWFDDPDSEEIEFFYGIEQSEEGEPDFIAFDNVVLRKDTDPEREWCWVKDWNDVASYCGMTEEEFLQQPLTRIVADLLSYYGYRNVFGETYGDSWSWNKNTQRFQ